MFTREDIEQLTEEFQACQKILVALGDENREHLLLEMMQMGECSGVRVGDIAAKTRLSRPAVSHHLQILKNAGILKMRREATKNYYYFDPDMESFDRLIAMLQRSKEIASGLPDRNLPETDNKERGVKYEQQI